jgi:peptide/nickel transport system substrate-binding protein
MHKELKRLGLWIFLVCVVTSFAVLGVGKDQILDIAVDGGDISTLDPSYANTTVDRCVVHKVYNSLVRYQLGDITEFEPDLATNWELAPDGKVWTFHLRHGVMVHDWTNPVTHEHHPSYELTSEDVVYSFEKAADPARSLNAGAFTGMSFRVVDDYTVQFILEEPLSASLFLPKVADYLTGLIIPKKPAEDLGDSLRNTVVGTGPFKYKEYRPREAYVLERWDNYFRGAPLLAGVTIHYVPDLNSRKFGLMKGDFDLIEGPPSQPWVEEMRALENTAVDVFGPGERIVFFFTATVEPLNDIRVRKAMCYALNREELGASLGADITEPTYSFVPSSLAGGLTKEEISQKDPALLYETDIAKAKELLAEAGYPDGFETLTVCSERGQYLLPTENFVAQLRRVGIDVKMQIVDHATHHHVIRESLNVSPIALYVCWRPNADILLTQWYYSESAVVTGKRPIQNYTQLGLVDITGDGQIDSIDSFIEAARGEVDAKKQAEYWKEANFKLLEWAACWPASIQLFTWARSERVHYGYQLKADLTLSPRITELAWIEE